MRPGDGFVLTRGTERQVAPDLGETSVCIRLVRDDDAQRGHGVAAACRDRRGVGRDGGATVPETWTYHHSPLAMPFWKQRMGYNERSVNLRKRL